MIERIEDSLNGGYAGLYGEVVTQDSYGIRGDVRFIPKVVFDIGGNIGIFARYARQLFPEAKIISVEPDKENCKVFKQFTNDENIVLIEKAIGSGMIWRCEQNINGAHESYLSSGLGYPFEVGKKMERIIETDTPSIMLDEIINEHYQSPSICKIDIEGAENAIFTHEPSMEALRKIDYVAMELHWNALTGNLRENVKDVTVSALKSFEETHYIKLDHIYFFAIKKQYGDTVSEKFNRITEIL